MADASDITQSFFPKQDAQLLGIEVFNRVSVPTDWCTGRQAQQLHDAGLQPPSLLEDIASGRTFCSCCTPEQAQTELAVMQQRARNKERE